jgi:hypothetical protein
MAVTVLPIGDGDAAAVGAFLHAHLNGRIAPEAWASAMRHPWDVAAPNHGFMLVDADGAIVGAQLAFYAERTIDGRAVRFCNLGAWCVLPGHRVAGVRLPRAVLAQPGYAFTDLSPSGTVVAMNRRLRFRSLDTATSLVPNAPWPTVPRAGAVTTDLDAIEAALEGDALTVFRDHRDAQAVRHLLVRDRAGSCHVMVRRDRRKGLPIFGSVLYVSDREVFRRTARRLSRHLLVRHGIAATLVEDRVAGARPPLSLRVARPRPKMYRSADLEPAQIDDLYSELVCVAW